MNDSITLRFSIRTSDLLVLARCATKDIAARTVAALIGTFENLWIDVDEAPGISDRVSYHVTVDPLFRLPVVEKCSAAECDARFGQFALAARAARAGL